jgi:ubiquitin conjugation factor E4 B
MKDPVILPSSKTTVDRPVIQRHLLSDSVTPLTCCFLLLIFHSEKRFTSLCFSIWLIVQTDPFNRSHLTADMLIPDVERKARIEEFIRSQEMKKHSEGLSMQSNKATIQPTNADMLID